MNDDPIVKGDLDNLDDQTGDQKPIVTAEDVDTIGQSCDLAHLPDILAVKNEHFTFKSQISMTDRGTTDNN